MPGSGRVFQAIVNNITHIVNQSGWSSGLHTGNTSQQLGFDSLPGQLTEIKGQLIVCLSYEHNFTINETLNL